MDLRRVAFRSLVIGVIGRRKSSILALHPMMSGLYKSRTTSIHLLTVSTTKPHLGTNIYKTTMMTSTETTTVSLAMATDTHTSWFDRATFYPPDPIFALTASFIADPDPNKVNLGQGTYRDDEGKPWILSSVHQAREKLISQKLYHEYLPILGLAEFRSRAAEVALGTRIYREHRETVRDPNESYDP